MRGAKPVVEKAMEEVLIVRRETHIPAPPAAVFALLTDPEKILSLSFWRDDAAIAGWRQLERHRMAQIGRAHV